MTLIITIYIILAIVNIFLIVRYNVIKLQYHYIGDIIALSLISSIYAPISFIMIVYDVFYKKLESIFNIELHLTPWR